jgi:hypothetical protein
MKLEIRIMQWENVGEGRKVLGLMGAWRQKGWCPDLHGLVKNTTTNSCEGYFL